MFGLKNSSANPTSVVVSVLLVYTLFPLPLLLGTLYLERALTAVVHWKKNKHAVATRNIIALYSFHQLLTAFILEGDACVSFYYFEGYAVVLQGHHSSWRLIIHHPSWNIKMYSMYSSTIIWINTTFFHFFTRILWYLYIILTYNSFEINDNTADRVDRVSIVCWEYICQMF